MSFGSTFEGEDDEGLLRGTETIASEPLTAEMFDAVKANPILVSGTLHLIESGRVTATDEQIAWLKAHEVLEQVPFAPPEGWAAGPTGGGGRYSRRDPRLDQFARSRAYAAANSVRPGIGDHDMQVVLTGMDALRSVAYRGLRALAQKITALAERVYTSP